MKTLSGDTLIAVLSASNEDLRELISAIEGELKAREERQGVMYTIRFSAVQNSTARGNILKHIRVLVDCDFSKALYVLEKGFLVCSAETLQQRSSLSLLEHQCGCKVTKNP
jgi:hypothetical protein